MKPIYFFLLLYNVTFAQSKVEEVSLFELKKMKPLIEEGSIPNTKLALQYLSKLESISEKNQNKQFVADLLTTKALVKIYLEKFDEALLLNQKAFLINEELKNNVELAKNEYCYARIFLRTDNLVKSTKHSFNAIELATKTKNYSLLQKMHNTLAMIYYKQLDYKKAIEHCEKSLAFQKNEVNLSTKGYSLGIIGLNNWELYRSFKNQNYFDIANSNYKMAYNTFLQKNDLFGLSWTLSYWSFMYEKKDIERSLIMKIKVNENYKKIGNTNYAFINNLGNIALNYSNIAINDSIISQLKSDEIPKNKKILIARASYYYQECIKLCKESKNLNYYQYILRLYADFQYRNGNIKEGYKNLQLSFTIYDSIFSQENKNKIAKLESAKEIQLKNNEIQLNKITFANKEKQKWFLIAGILLLGIIGSLLFFQSRKRKQTNQKLQLLNSELDEANKAKTRFFSILNHDLRGPVANLVFFLQLQKENPEMLDEESIQRMQDKTMTGAENLLASMEDILHWSKSQMENFKPQPQQFQIATLFDDTQKHFSSEETIDIRFENPYNLTLTTDENYLKTIVRNLTGNAVKALINVQNPTIVWKAFQNNGNTILSIADNGKGASDDEFKALYDDKEVVGIKTGLGLHLIRDLAKAIDCEIKVVTAKEKGTTITLKL